MEPLKSEGSAGSCDSMESILSNHSALSGYDDLSAEERECLMFLEETIDSLDNDDDSGLSNDELETTDKPISLPVSELEKVPHPVASEKNSPKITAIPKSQEWTNEAFAFNTQGYNSFPRAVQASKEQSGKQTSGSILADPNKDQVKLWPEKTKSMSSINQEKTEDSLTCLILPPPDAFRDLHVLDKRRSVTDPTDAREVKFDRTIFNSSMISEVPPRELPPNKDLARSQETHSPPLDKQSQEMHSQPLDKQSHFKYGPPTAPKPRTLPPHIIIKTSKGVVQNLDPQKRPRTFSAHERGTDKTNEHNVVKVPHSNEQERMRFEALKKLGLEDRSGKQESSSAGHFRTNVSVPEGSNQGQQDAKGYKISSIVNQQDVPDFQRSIPAEPTNVAQTVSDDVKKDGLSKNRLSIKLNTLDKTGEPASGAPLVIQKGTYISSDDGIAGNKSSIFGRNRPSVKKPIQENMEGSVMQSSQPLNEAHRAPPPPSSINIVSGSPRNPSQSNPVPQPNVRNSTDDPAYKLKESPPRIDNVQSHIRNISKSQENTKASAVPINAPITVQNVAAVSEDKISGGSQVSNSQENKGSSSESNSPGSAFIFPRPKEVLIPQHSPEVIRRDKDRSVANKNNRHSTPIEIPSEQFLRLPQGSVPGLRQINIKSSTLERSGVGLSGSLSSIDKESQKGGNSFFRKPLFSGNFLRNNRPRPLSLGTGKDFASLEPSSTDAANTEKRSFFSRPSRPSAQVTSVKITPKGSTDEHRREALKKLGILKE